jgi:hypothetical protein
MRNGVLIDEAQASGNAIDPSPGFTGLKVSGDDFRAFLALCLAASLLSVYTIAWATGAVSL